jgi:hypothetical protein
MLHDHGTIAETREVVHIHDFNKINWITGASEYQDY